MISGALAVGVWGSGAAAREPGSHTVATRPDAKRPETSPNDFVTVAARRGLANVELGELVLQRTQNPDVRRLARRLIDAHMRAYDDLLGLASEAGVQAPQTMDLEQRTIKTRLAGLSGASFDRAYLDAIRTNQERDIAVYRGYARNGKDAGLKAWAEQMLPAIRKQQQLTSAASQNLPPERSTSRSTF